MKPQVKSIDAPEYRVTPAPEPDEAILEKAREILRSRMNTAQVFDSPQLVKDFLQMEAARHPDCEVFGVLFLDAQHRMISFHEMFRGTLTQTSVYPREVVREALEVGASSVILTHNHPSGCLKPSKADELLTQTLKSALTLIDIKVLDHIITSNAGALSMAEKGLI